jgi:hypothetical protein
MKKLFILLFFLMMLTACVEAGEPMVAKFQIIKPQATENLITSPSIEGNVIYFPIPPHLPGSVLGWEAVGSTLAQVIEPARFGKHSLQVVTNGAANHEGTYFRVDPNTSDTYYAGSVYVRGQGRVRARLVDSMGGEWISDAFQLRDDRWLRVMDLIGKTGPVISNDLRLYVETEGVQAITFNVDGAVIEPGTWSTTYCDGDQDGCTWNVIAHASTSDRSSQERSGGQLIDITDERVGAYVTTVSGIGFPPYRHNLQDRALLPGMEYQGTKILPRTILLTMHIANENYSGLDLYAIHAKRREIENLIKLDVVSPTQPFVLRYNGGDVPLDIECIYDSGMEFDGDIRNPWTNAFSLRLICPDVFWKEDNQEVSDLDLMRSMGFVDGILRRVDGEWMDWGGTLWDPPPVGAYVNISERAPDGRIYIGGNFQLSGGILVNNIAFWDGENWNPLNDAVFGPGLNGVVYAIAIAQDGVVYLGGTFNDVAGGPGLTYPHIVGWNPVTETYFALGPGLNASVRSIDVTPDGQVYVVGTFTDVFGGVGFTLNGTARWDPNNLTWNTMGAGPGFSGGSVEAIQIDKAGNYAYVGGGFTQEFGGAPNSLVGIAIYDIAADTFAQLGDGLTPGDFVYDLALALNGDLYIAGNFTTIGGVAANYAAVWKGSSFHALGSGLSGIAYLVDITPSGIAWYGGNFNATGDGLYLHQGFGAWNGSVWFRPPLRFGGLPIISGVVDSEGTLHISGGINAATESFAAAVTEVNNPGTSDVQPIVEILGPGHVIWLENITTGDVIYLDYTLLAGEQLIIDFRTGHMNVTSSWRGPVMDAILPQSAFSSFHLQPGANRINFFMDDITETSDAQIRFVPQYESVD